MPKKATLDSIAVILTKQGKTLANHGKQIDALTAIVEKGFASVASDISDLKDDFADIKREMATKDDVRDMLRDELAPIRTELASIRRDLEDLTDKVDNLAGFRKEIDHALERIARIEKHLGLDNKVAA